MNPFDLRGPQFLLFYLVLMVATAWLVALFRRSRELADRPDSIEGGIRQNLVRLHTHGEQAVREAALSDPYRIAYLRGGENEALRVAAVSLTDRGLLVATGDQLKIAPGAKPEQARRPIERKILEHFLTSREAKTIFGDSDLNAACAPYSEDLRKGGFLPDDEIRSMRRRLYLGSFVFLAGVAGLKIAVALARGRKNIWFLVVLALVSLVLLAVACFPRLTARGRELLSNLRTLFGGLKDRASTIRPGGSTSELVLLSAVFGIAAVDRQGFPWVKKLFPAAESSNALGSSTSCGSSCGSSGGSSCGGGCGGGCGGCGG